MTLLKRIEALIAEHGTIHGTENFALLVRAKSKSNLIQYLRVIAQRGEITIVPSSGGRGRKTVYKRNRNSPGYPRKK